MLRIITILFFTTSALGVSADEKFHCFISRTPLSDWKKTSTIDLVGAGFFEEDVITPKDHLKLNPLGMNIFVAKSEIISEKVTSILNEFRSEDMGNHSLQVLINFKRDTFGYLGYEIEISERNKRNEILTFVSAMVLKEDGIVLKTKALSRNINFYEVSCGFLRD
jgi:hypothetical protein